jgi:polar amino acid transport system permease protein
MALQFASYCEKILEPLRNAEALHRQLKVACESLPILWDASLVTLSLTVCLLMLGFILSIPVSLGQLYGPAPVRWAMSGYEKFFRALPVLILLILFFFGFPLLFKVTLPAFASAVLVFGLHSAAYQSQILRGAIQSISQGQILASRAIGMSRWQAMRYIVLPQAFRLAIPGWSNEYSSALKDTSFAFAVGLVELTQQAKQIANTNRQIFVLALTVAVIYLLLTTVGTRLLETLERRYRIPGLSLHQGSSHTHG